MRCPANCTIVIVKVSFSCTIRPRRWMNFGGQEIQRLFHNTKYKPVKQFLQTCHLVFYSVSMKILEYAIFFFRVKVYLYLKTQSFSPIFQTCNQHLPAKSRCCANKLCKPWIATLGILLQICTRKECEVC